MVLEKTGGTQLLPHTNLTKSRGGGGKKNVERTSEITWGGGKKMSLDFLGERKSQKD